MTTQEVLKLESWQSIQWTRYSEYFIQQYISMYAEPERAKATTHEKNLTLFWNRFRDEQLTALGEGTITAETYDERMNNYDYDRNYNELCEFFNSKCELAFEPAKVQVLSKYIQGEDFNFLKLSEDFKRKFGESAQDKLDKVIADGYIIEREGSWRWNV